MKVTKEELEVLKDFKRRDDAIYKMLEKLTAQQHQLEVEQEKWFMAVRERLNIKPETNITVRHDTGEVLEVE